MARRDLRAPGRSPRKKTSNDLKRWSLAAGATRRPRLSDDSPSIFPGATRTHSMSAWQERGNRRRRHPWRSRSGGMLMYLRERQPTPEKLQEIVADLVAQRAGRAPCLGGPAMTMGFNRRGIRGA